MMILVFLKEIKYSPSPNKTKGYNKLLLASMKISALNDICTVQSSNPTSRQGQKSIPSQVCLTPEVKFQAHNTTLFTRFSKILVLVAIKPLLLQNSLKSKSHLRKIQDYLQIYTKLNYHSFQPKSSSFLPTYISYYHGQNCPNSD